MGSDETPEPKAAVIQHTRATRWMHWINFPILAIMIWSGLRIYWADLRDPHVLSVAGIEVFRFFPEWVNETFGLRAKLAQGLGYHLFFAWLFTLNGLIYVVYTIRSGHWRNLNPGRAGFRKALHEIRNAFTRRPNHDATLGYNPAQRIIYNLIVLLGGVSVLSGFAIYRPNTLWFLTSLFGGYQMAKTIHFIVTIVFIAFFFVHVAQVLRAGPTALAAMVTGPRSRLAKTALTRLRSPDGATQETPPTPLASPSTQPSFNEDESSERPLIPATGSAPNLQRRALLTAGLTVGVSVVGWRSFRIKRDGDRLPAVLRSSHELVEQAWRPIDQRAGTVRTFSPTKAGDIRVNGRHGIREPIDLDAWRLTVVNGAGEQIDSVAMADIRSLPEFSMTTEHICIEGWSQIVTWTGVRFSDFAQQYGDQVGAYQFVNMSTPDNGYYTSVDAETMQNPYTLLAYALNDEPLSQDHGAPLRLATPKKYGIKQIKRIGNLEFSQRRGPDYWAERGYDWYAHL